MNRCSCQQGEVLFYCDQDSVCNNQRQYCIDCMDLHKHQPKKLSNQLTQWQSFIEKLQITTSEEAQQFDKYSPLLSYLEQQTSIIVFDSKVLPSILNAAIELNLQSRSDDIRVKSQQQLQAKIDNHRLLNEQHIIDTYRVFISDKSEINYDNISLATHKQLIQLKNQLNCFDSQYMINCLFRLNDHSQSIESKDKKQFQQWKQIQELHIAQLSRQQTMINTYHKCIMSKIQQLESKYLVQQNAHQSNSHEYIKQGQQELSTLRILHIHNFNHVKHCPTNSLLKQEALKVQVNLQVDDYDSEQQQALNISDYDSILVSFTQSNNTNHIGNVLYQCLKNRKTIVLIGDANISKGMNFGDFTMIPPLVNIRNRFLFNQSQIVIIAKNHPIFKQFSGFVQVQTKKSALELNTNCSVQVLALWDDGYGCIALRNDQDAPIFSFGYSNDCYIPIINALNYGK